MKVVIACLLSAGTLTAQAACITDEEAQQMAANYAAMQPLPNPDAALTMEDARCGAAKFAKAMEASQGKRVGYKAGLTNPAVQARFNTPHPLAGPMFEKTFLQDGAQVPAKFGARPLFEADLVVEVSGPGVHDAKDVYEVQKYVEKIYPFIELPDLMVQDPGKLAGPQVQLINVGPRLGVLGKPFVLPMSKASVDSLASMTVKLLDGEGKTFDEGKGAAILNHPFNAVIWLADELKKQGITLKRGDLLSLGSFSRLHPPKPGMVVKVVYEGIDGANGTPSATVSFK